MHGASAVLFLFALGAQEIPTETVEIPGTTLKIELVRVPGGKLKSASRETEIRPFWIGKFEVSREAFIPFYDSRSQAKVDGVTRPSEPFEEPNREMDTEKHPAVSMKWHGALGFCEWLGMKTGQSFRLPTEAEWEYACRAGSTGATADPIGDHAWTKENSGDLAHESGKKKANAFGLHDMLGNAWEYCLEPFAPPAYGSVLRGGAFDTPAAKATFTQRQPGLPEWSDRDSKSPKSLWWCSDAPFVGMRIVRVQDAAGRKAHEAYFGKLEFSNLKREKPVDGLARVAGEVRNAGDRAVEELEVRVFYLDAEGKPLFSDREARPTFGVCYPVLLHSAFAGDQTRPLKPGESRKFELDVPHPYDGYGPAALEKVAAKATGLRLAEGSK